MPDASVNLARSLRQRMTDAERKLWLRLRDRRLGGHKFLRQVPIGPYVADFACRDAKLVVEVDGSGHARSDRDATRDEALIAMDYRVLRFWNADILRQTDDVCETIVAALDRRLEGYDRSEPQRMWDRKTPHPAFGHLLPARWAKGTPGSIETI